MAAAGMAAVTERYSWIKDSERLDAALRRVVAVAGRLGEPDKDD
jgi:hypothetical protein